MFLVLTTHYHAHIPLGSQCRSSTRYLVTLRCPLAQARERGVSPRSFTDAVGGKCYDETDIVFKYTYMYYTRFITNKDLLQQTEGSHE